jgi:hypothetical protein
MDFLMSFVRALKVNAVNNSRRPSKSSVQACSRKPWISYVDLIELNSEATH